MTYDCTECDRLWKEYAEATKAVMKIVANRQIAIFQHDSAALTRLDPAHRQASERRETARRAVKEHEAAHRDNEAVMWAS